MKILCRICLSTKIKFDLTELQVTNLVQSEVKQSYKEILFFCLGIQVSENEEFSSKLCGKCYHKIVGFHEFKTLAHKNNAHFKFIHNNTPLVSVNNVKIKTENESDDVLETKTDYNEFVILKEECDDIDFSEDEYLSAIKNNYSENKDNEQVEVLDDKLKPKKRGRPKSLKPKIKQETTKICDECGKEVKNLKTHLLLHQPADARKTYQCELCEKTFSTSQAKRKHHKKKHLGIVKKNKCDICEKWFTALDVHILTIHRPEELPYECASCGRRFITKARLSQHIVRHTEDKPFECNICKNKYTNKTSLQLHIRSIHNKEKTHLCQYCSKSFFSKNHFLSHLRIHTKEKPYKCTQCGKGFRTSSGRVNHMYVHSDKKKFNCSQCDMSFNAPNYLRQHMLSHTREKKFPCQYCDTRFHRSDHRKRHEYTAHLKHINSTPSL